MVKFESFLVLDRDYGFNHNKSYTQTIGGQIVYNVGGYIPVIIKGTGCIGIGYIENISIDVNVTKVRFKFVRLHEQECAAHYNLYTNNISMGTGNSDGDIYEDSQDVLIPGLMGKKQKRASGPAPMGCAVDFDDDDDDNPPSINWPWMQ